MPPSDLGDLPTVLLNEHAARHLHRFPDGTLRASVTPSRGGPFGQLTFDFGDCGVQLFDDGPVR